MIDYLLMALAIIVFVFLVFMIGTFFCGYFQCMIFRKDHKINTNIRRSFCDSCGKTLWWLDSVPFISYLLLQGKCRYCSMQLPIKYFVAETISGLLMITLLVVPISYATSVPMVMALIFITAFLFYYFPAFQ